MNVGVFLPHHIIQLRITNLATIVAHELEPAGLAAKIKDVEQRMWPAESA